MTHPLAQRFIRPRYSPFPSLVRLAALALLVQLSLAGISAAQQAPAPRVVDIAAADGTVLKGTFFAAAKPGPGVLLLHQCNRERKVWDSLAQSLAASGVNVLTIDFRGYGDSGGTPMKYLTDTARQKEIAEKWPGDVDAAFDYLIEQPSVNPKQIGAGGASCGVNQAVQLARRHPEVKSLVLLSETTDVAGRQFLRSSPQIPLFLAVADDDPDPGVVELVEWLFTLSKNPTSHLEHYDGGGHGVEMFVAHPELPGMIVAWWDSELQGKAPPSQEIGEAPLSRESHLLDEIDQPGGAAKVAAMYAEAKSRDPKAVWLSEEVVNRIGYEHLQGGDAKNAVEIMKLNVLANPDSPNAYDSLGDAYLADGQKDLARANAKKALELLKSDTKDPEDVRKEIQQSAEAKLKTPGDSPK